MTGRQTRRVAAIQPVRPIKERHFNPGAAITIGCAPHSQLLLLIQMMDGEDEPARARERAGRDRSGRAAGPDHGEIETASS